MTTTPQNVTYASEHITPDTAKKYLAQNQHNRLVKSRHVDTLAREMTEKRWRMNGQPIVFADSGRLLDGQHRLNAVIQSGETIETIVLRGVSEEAYGTIDQGVKRSAADDLRSMGVPNSIRVAAAARIILLWEKNLPQKEGVSKFEIAQFVAANPTLAEVVTHVKSKTLPLPPSALAAVGWLAMQTGNGQYEDMFYDFCTKLHSGANLSEGSPILTLRNAAMGLRKGASISTDGWFGLCATAWNDYAKGKSRKILKSPNWPAEIVGCPHKRKVQIAGGQAGNYANAPAALDVMVGGKRA
jgi:hypothetical protein